MALRVRILDAPGGSLGYSIERLSDGLHYDFATSGATAGRFTATPVTPIRNLTAEAGRFQGRYSDRLDQTPPEHFTDGSYCLTIHDRNATDAPVGLLNVEMSGGDDAPARAVATSSDPWAAPLPGTYPLDTVGGRIGAFLDAPVSSRSTYAGGPVASVTAPVTVGTNQDKAGYGLAQPFPANFATLAIDSSGRIQVQQGTGLGQFTLISGRVQIQPGTAVGQINLSSGKVPAMLAAGDVAGNLPADLKLWLGAAPAALQPGGRVEAHSSVVGDKQGYALAAAPPTAAQIRQEIDANSTKLDVSVGSRLAASAYTAPNNVGIASAAALAAKLDTAMEAAGSAHRFTAAALAQASMSTGGVSLAQLQGELDARDVRADRLGRLDAPVSSRSTYAGGPVASVTAPVTVGTNQDKAGYALSAAGLDAVTVEPGINVRQALAPILAATAGVVSGAGSGTITIRGGNSESTRIVATTDADGNRLTVALSLPA